MEVLGTLIMLFLIVVGLKSIFGDGRTRAQKQIEREDLRKMLKSDNMDDVLDYSKKYFLEPRIKGKK